MLAKMYTSQENMDAKIDVNQGKKEIKMEAKI
jgi:hypothetical protein